MQLSNYLKKRDCIQIEYVVKNISCLKLISMKFSGNKNEFITHTNSLSQLFI